MSQPLRFGLLGAAGYVAPRHMQAISTLGHHLVAACDTHDGVGVLDRHFPHCQFFTEVERFDRHLEKLRRRGQPVDYISICTPNYLHDAHCRLALRVKSHAICEKPLVISPWNIDQLLELEQEHGRSIWTILQLRLHPEVQRLKAALQQATASVPRTRTQVRLTYATHRGPWYQRSWKGDTRRSGSLAMNIGVHFFDMLCWLFGSLDQYEVIAREDNLMQGRLILQHADVEWLLSTSMEHVPEPLRNSGQRVYRALQMGEDSFDFSSGFDDLHTKSYANILNGDGFTVEDARQSIELVHKIRTCPIGAMVSAA